MRIIRSNYDIAEMEQEYTSERTSVNKGKLPAIFRMIQFQPNTINLDYGGGKYDNAAEYLEPQDVLNLVYDPYNRTPQHNSEVLQIVRDNGGADTVTLSNVLNVIKEPEVRLNVLENIKKLLKPSGTLYITVYEGSGEGVEGPTTRGYQLNRKTASYLDEIQQVFPDARCKNSKLIIAHPGGRNMRISSATNTSNMMMLPGIGDYEPEDGFALEDVYDVISSDVTLTYYVDAIIAVDSEGYWDFEDPEAFALWDYDSDCEDFLDGVEIDDEENIQDNIYMLINDFGLIPLEQGRYKVTCNANLLYSVSNILEAKRDWFGDYKYPGLDAYDTDEIDVDFQLKSSSITNWKCNKIM